MSNPEPFKVCVKGKDYLGLLCLDEGTAVIALYDNITGKLSARDSLLNLIEAKHLKLEDVQGARLWLGEQLKMVRVL